MTPQSQDCDKVARQGGRCNAHRLTEEQKRKTLRSRSPLARLDGNQQQQQHDPDQLDTRKIRRDDNDILSSSIRSLTPATGSNDADIITTTTKKKKATTVKPMVRQTKDAFIESMERKAPFNSNNKKRLSDDIPKASNETTTTTTTNAQHHCYRSSDCFYSQEKRKQRYSDETKIQVLLALETRPGTRLCDIAREFEIPHTTIFSWRQDADKIRKKVVERKDKKTAEEKVVERKDKKTADENFAAALAAGFLRGEKNIKILFKEAEEKKRKIEEEKTLRDDKKTLRDDKKTLRDDKKEAKKRKILDNEKKVWVDKIAESNRKIRAGEKERQLQEQKKTKKAKETADRKALQEEEKTLRDDKKEAKKRKIDNEKKVWVDKIAESNRKIRAGEKERQLQEQKKTKKAKETADRKALQEENKKEQGKVRADKNMLTVLNPDCKTFKICDDHEVNEINKFRTDMLVSEEETGGLTRVIDEDGTDLSSHGIYKLKKVYPEATSDILTGKMKSIEISEFSTPGSPTSTVQIVGKKGHIIKPDKLGPRLAHRIKVSKSGKFGETPAYTDNLKVQKYKGPGGKHRDGKFKNLINKPGIPKSSFLAARVLEKTDGGFFNWFRESDGKEFLIEIKKGELLILMAHAGLCNHNSQEGLFTIVTDFVLPYDVIRRERDDNGGVDGKCEQMIRKFAKEISQH